MNWIPMVWCPFQSKSAFHATGQKQKFTLSTHRRTPPTFPISNQFVFVPSGRSCRLAPLIQCDYCPLLFHMDCLDPPLTALPAGKWMCPNHVEHLVVSKRKHVFRGRLSRMMSFPSPTFVQLNQRSLSLSSRCQLFDQFQDRMSQHAVKLDFLRQVHRQNAPNRRSAHQHSKKTIKVSALLMQLGDIYKIFHHRMDIFISSYQNMMLLLDSRGKRL